ncbi:hypothetical protein KO494_14755 [Lacinutrix sp. C3R15]|uniref:hypothetical protein n=1 Tax=Flavobacteriaceae TaxID=49546 RepID=UPI001C09D5E0|nr:MULTISPECIES: hypothetical protein [Flavobacteriaceae]MBU2940806.1 hypothetical protein [Lacinutrix sp. C3R15]MDO6624124.1 hypothetical protein [Oceanihabitans sp. 1_MG-2023]
MKYLRFIILAPFLMAFQCESDDPSSFDNLEATGLLGRWEIQDEIINGSISDMTPKCCEFLEFNLDDNIKDTIGFLTYTDSQDVVNIGVFEVELNNQSIIFTDEESDEFTFEFEVDDVQQNLTLDFTKDGTNYIQTWVKIE